MIHNWAALKVAEVSFKKLYKWKTFIGKREWEQEICMQKCPLVIARLFYSSVYIAGVYKSDCLVNAGEVIGLRFQFSKSWN